MSHTNPRIWELEEDENWEGRKDFLREDDTMTLSTYCRLCNKEHELICIVARKMLPGQVTITIFKKANNDKCPNMIDANAPPPKDINLLKDDK